MNCEIDFRRALQPLFEVDSWLLDGGCIERINDSTVQADTNLFFSECNGGKDFLHGADTMIPAGRLVKHLLREGEALSGIDHLRWKAQMTSNLRITASVDCAHDLNGQKPQMQAAFSTDQGRKIIVSGVCNDIPIDQSLILKETPIARGVFGEARGSATMYESGHFAMRMQSAQNILDDIQASDNALGFSLSGFVDSTVAGFNALMSGAAEYAAMYGYGNENPAMRDSIAFFREQALKKKQLFLMLGLKNFKLPPIEEFLCNEGGIFLVKAGFAKAKERGDSAFLPLEVRVMNKRGAVIGGGESMIAIMK